jgi:hypothetical protein
MLGINIIIIFIIAIIITLIIMTIIIISITSGTVVIKSEVKVDCRDLFCVAFQGQKLLNKAGFLGTSNV